MSPIDVETVPEVWEYLRVRRCGRCLGEFHPVHPQRDKQTAREGRYWMDTFTLTCASCGEKEQVAFRIDTASPRYQRMAARTDVAGYVMARFTPDELGVDPDEARQLLVKLVQDPDDRDPTVPDPLGDPEARLAALFDAVAFMLPRYDLELLDAFAQEGPLSICEAAKAAFDQTNV